MVAAKQQCTALRHCGCLVLGAMRRHSLFKLLAFKTVFIYYYIEILSKNKQFYYLKSLIT